MTCTSKEPTPNLVRSKIFNFVGSMFRPAIDCVGNSHSRSSSLSYTGSFEHLVAMLDVMVVRGLLSRWARQQSRNNNKWSDDKFA
jgi:hypothetical protein